VVVWSGRGRQAWLGWGRQLRIRSG
jgi:hypothetical protein